MGPTATTTTGSHRLVGPVWEPERGNEIHGVKEEDSRKNHGASRRGRTSMVSLRHKKNDRTQLWDVGPAREAFSQ